MDSDRYNYRRLRIAYREKEKRNTQYGMRNTKI
jgi:hypothetical protein